MKLLQSDRSWRHRHRQERAGQGLAEASAARFTKPEAMSPAVASLLPKQNQAAEKGAPLAPARRGHRGQRSLGNGHLPGGTD